VWGGKPGFSRREAEPHSRRRPDPVHEALSACGAVKPRDKNSAQVMVNRAGFNPAGVDRVRLGSPMGNRAA